MEAEKGVQRWLVDISNWNPSPQDFTSTISLLPQHEHPSITRFLKMDDRKRAVVSRLLQYGLIHEVLGIPFDEIVIKRTLEGKPYLEFDDINMRFPNFNFNVSHQGDYIGIACEPLCVLGLDIVSISVPTNETVPDFIQNFSAYFSPSEWNNIIAHSDQMLEQFYRYWCLKEAFVKAIGIGVGFRLDTVEFHHSNWTNIFVKVDGKELKDWRFVIFELEKNHLASIAKGPPCSATESYKKTLKQIAFDENEYRLALNGTNKGFVLKTVEELFSIFILG